jgi:hypothetical protein
MVGKGGNDTYTNFARGNSGVDFILDSGGKDKLLLTNYSTHTYQALDYVNNNGKADTLAIYLDPKGTKKLKNAVVILYFFDDKKSIPNKPKTWVAGPGFVELIKFKK